VAWSSYARPVGRRPAGSVRFCVTAGSRWARQWGAKAWRLPEELPIYRSAFYTGTSWASLDTANTPIHVASMGTTTYRIIPSVRPSCPGGRVTISRPARPCRSRRPRRAESRSDLARDADKRSTSKGSYHAYRGSIVAQPTAACSTSSSAADRGLPPGLAKCHQLALRHQGARSSARCYALTHMGSTGLYDVDDTTSSSLSRDRLESGSQNAAVDQTAARC